MRRRFSHRANLLQSFDQFIAAQFELHCNILWQHTLVVGEFSFEQAAGKLCVADAHKEIALFDADWQIEYLRYRLGDPEKRGRSGERGWGAATVGATHR